MSEKTKLLSNNISFQQFAFRRVPEKMKEKDTKLKKQSVYGIVLIGQTILKTN